MRDMYQNQRALKAGSKCERCGGTGWVLEIRKIEDYDDHHEVAIPCPVCKGFSQEQDTTGIPQQFREAYVQDFGFQSYESKTDVTQKIVINFFENYSGWWAKGKGLYLWSRTPGSGKTCLACSLGNSIRRFRQQQTYFVTAPDYLAAVMDGIDSRKRGGPDRSEKYRECDVLILDDLGAQKGGEWQDQEFFRLVNHRMEKRFVTVYTSNVPPEKLKLEARTVDRIARTSIVLQMPEESLRAKEARREQDAFLKQVLS